jgi:hypothetical protein
MLIQVGCEARKTPAITVVFFLDFSFYRTNQALAKKRHPKRIIWGTFPAFSGNLYRRGNSRHMGKTTLSNVWLGNTG